MKKRFVCFVLVLLVFASLIPSVTAKAELWGFAMGTKSDGSAFYYNTDQTITTSFVDKQFNLNRTLTMYLGDTLVVYPRNNTANVNWTRDPATQGLGTLTTQNKSVNAGWGFRTVAWVANFTANRVGTTWLEYPGQGRLNIKIVGPYDRNVTVRFKIQNGTWADGTTGDKTYTLKASNGNWATLPQNYVPTGMKANAKFGGGSWDKTPNTNANSEWGDTYTYSFKPVNYSASITPRATRNGQAVDLNNGVRIGDKVFFDIKLTPNADPNTLAQITPQFTKMTYANVTLNNANLNRTPFTRQSDGSYTWTADFTTSEAFYNTNNLNISNNINLATGVDVTNLNSGVKREERSKRTYKLQLVKTTQAKIDNNTAQNDPVTREITFISPNFIWATENATFKDTLPDDVKNQILDSNAIAGYQLVASSYPNVLTSMKAGSAVTLGNNDQTIKFYFTQNGDKKLTINNTYSGNMADKNDTLDYKVKLISKDGAALIGNYSGLNFNNDGEATFTMKVSDSKEIEMLPSEAKYEVTVLNADSKGYTVSVNNTDSNTANGTILQDEVVTFGFVKNATINTGIKDDDIVAFMTILSSALGALIIFLIRRKKCAKSD